MYMYQGSIKQPQRRTYIYSSAVSENADIRHLKIMTDDST